MILFVKENSFLLFKTYFEENLNIIILKKQKKEIVFNEKIVYNRNDKNREE